VKEVISGQRHESLTRWQLTDKGKYLSNHANEEGQSLRWPTAAVLECGKDSTSITMRSKDDNGDEDGKEAGNVED